MNWENISHSSQIIGKFLIILHAWSCAVTVSLFEIRHFELTAIDDSTQLTPINRVYNHHEFPRFVRDPTCEVVSKPRQVGHVNLKFVAYGRATCSSELSTHPTSELSQ
jgi:hypothetical protein